MPVQAKICGLNSPDGVHAALAGKAAWLGFVFFEASPRHLTVERAVELVRPVRGAAKTVALLVDPTNDALRRVVEAFAPDMIQLHGREDPRRTAELRALAGRPVIKALPVSDASDLDAAKAFEGAADHLLFDARPPRDADRPGGHGARFDWTLLHGRRFARPWLLAGGLDPWNVGEAVRLSGAAAVDVSSGVERGQGVKDPALISAFLAAAHSA